MRTIAEATLIVLLTLVAATATHHFHPRAPAWHLIDEPLLDDEVTLASITQQWNNDVLWIDARPRSDYETAHIPGALLLNEQEANDLLFDYFETLQDNTKPIVIYCGSEACQASRKMKDYLRERLPTADIYLLKGGWKSWTTSQSSPATPQP
ncbi:rhodanese-like domain-containing protein [Phragmitibacter flavus]|uniref:Rhodanese-like domain-containing protein n=1 Tax=Phragmitibacter flavus TaxID=2576071 RepID=A0A5R8KFB6_9BACT|nr:rhodanese-like domain-containing protein [Phragmitibacter flavus]TLD70951.1 rhodanese-like domain-containing protein [Phragmitibacter flavus]